jgi:Ser/Thr protein kinase RdoA (MazF antagonist)
MQATAFGHHGHHLPAAVVAAWQLGAGIEIEALSRSGFSGSEVYRVSCGDRRLVLKSFARDTTPTRARWIHRLVRHLTVAGLAEVPALTPASDGDTIVTDADGTMWELARLVSGTPDDAPDERRTAAAMAVLARLHGAAATFAGGHAHCDDPPAVARRRSQAAALSAHPWAARRDAAGAPRAARVGDPMLDRWDAAIAVAEAHSAAAAIAAVATFPLVSLPMQPVLRDVWSAHVLFDAAGHVAGIIDFHAADLDTPATDLARLLGSWWATGAEGGAAAAALDAYERVRPLAPGERQLVPWLDAAGVVCGLDNWFRWTVEEGRAFPNLQAVLTRVDRLLARLPGALATLCRLASAR